MKSTIQLDERRTLALMDVINKGKYVNIPGLFRYLRINENSFNNSLKKIKAKNPEKYINYLYINEQNMKEFKSLCKRLIYIMEDMLINGIELENGTKREFDIVDWYYIKNRYFQGVSRKFISQMITEVDMEGRGTGFKATNIRKLISANSSDNMGNFVKTISSQHVLNDEYHDLTQEEKEQIIRYFNQNQIPYTYDTLYCIADRLKKNRENNLDCFKINMRVR